MNKVIFILFYFIICVEAPAQCDFKLLVKDSATKQSLSFATVQCTSVKRTVAGDSTGLAIIKNLPAGIHTFKISIVGFEEKIITQTLPQTDSFFVVLMNPKELKDEVVVVASSRTNSRIEDLPTKVEVLGLEELTEENGIKPGNIASLLGDIAGIQIQQTSASTGNVDMRVQGLPGKYTQILRDGMPLFGGYSGSFSILQIPPLDLHQIEIVKGASSTLYGGGAIAGMVNLISKSPVVNKPEYSLTLNQTTLRESNVNLFFSNRNKKLGYTLFAGGTNQKSMDVNNDGFSDVPKIRNVFIHPRLFIYPNEKDKITLGYTINYEYRNGGDMQVVNKNSDAIHQFFIQNKSLRNVIDASWQHLIDGTSSLQFKGSTSFFDRGITTNVFGMKARQLAYFTEITYNKKYEYHSIVAGINFIGDNFRKKIPDSTRMINYNQNTIGIFLQDDWKIAPQFIVQSGLRFDRHDIYGNFILPRLSMLYRINTHFSTRMGVGLGYKIPSIFNGEVDERDYPGLLPISNVKAERSYGANWDVNYKQIIDEWKLTVNQMFYITQIEHPLVLNKVPYLGTGPFFLSYSTANKPLRTSGFETYIAATHDELELYLGYTYTVAKQLYNTAQSNVSLSARNKFASVIAYEFSPKCRAGIEAAYTGTQYLDDGTRTPGYLFAAAMVRYNIGKAAIVLNCENLLDYRQTKKENIVMGNITNPKFKQIWAPIDGRVINLSMNFKW